MKMYVLVEEGLRRLRNKSRGLEWERSKSGMEQLAQKLHRIGYPEIIRHEVINSACEKYDKMRDEKD